MRKTSCQNIMKNFPKITEKNKVGTPNVLAVFLLKKFDCFLLQNLLTSLSLLMVDVRKKIIFHF